MNPTSNGMARRSLAVLAGCLLAALALRPGLGQAPTKDADRGREVARLVEQLRDPDPARRAAGVTALLKLGPDILPLLPGPDAPLTAEQKEQLDSIRKDLREARARRELAPRMCSFPARPMPLKTALAELTRQTGIAVADFRQNTEDDPEVKLDLPHGTFWQGLDAIARAADLRVALYRKEAAVGLGDGPNTNLPVSYNGLFRVVLKRITLVSDLERGERICVLTLELAWEPRFRALMYEPQPQGFEARDDRGDDLKALESMQGRAAVSRPTAIETQIRLEAPPRKASRIALLKGTLAVLGPSRMLTFTFDHLNDYGKDTPKRDWQQVRDGVAARLREFTRDTEAWTVGLTLEYPPDSPDFESFESWLVNNQAFLEKKATGKRYPANGGFSIDEQSGRRAVVTYHFTEENNFQLGKPEDWRLVYQTPGPIVRLPVPFEFRDLSLP